MKRVIKIFAGITVLCLVQAIQAQNVEFVASYDTPGRATGVLVSGDYAYVADYTDGLQILSVLDPYNPAPAGSLQTLYPAFDVLVSGDYAYVNEGDCFWNFCVGDIEIIDVSDPAVPDSVGGTGVGYTLNFFVPGNYVYCTWTSQWDSGLYIIDVSDPDSAFVVNDLGAIGIDCEGIPPIDYGAVFVSDSYLYAIFCLHLVVWDISDPYNASVVGSCMLECSEYYTDIFVAGDYAYMACDENGLSVVNVANPSDPYPVGSFDTQGPARDVFVSGQYAYVAERGSGLQIFNISEPANPVVAGSYDTPGYARRVHVQDDFIYVADTSSLIILRFNPLTEIEEVAGLPRQLALNQNYPNPFNASTSISYSLSEAGNVTIDIYDLLGRKVQELFEANQAPGEHEVLWNAGDLPSGIYFATLKAGSQGESIRMALLK